MATACAAERGERGRRLESIVTRRFITGADLALLHALARAAPNLFGDTPDDYAAGRRYEDSEQLRLALGGAWAVLAVLATTLVLAFDGLTKLGDGPAFIILGAGFIALPLAMSIVHGVVEGVYKRERSGEWTARLADSNRTFLVVLLITFSGVCLALRR